MALSPPERYIAKLEGQTQLAFLILRALIQQVVLKENNPHAVLADLFGRLNLLLDQIETEPSSGEFADEIRAAMRPALDELQGQIMRDTGLHRPK